MSSLTIGVLLLMFATLHVCARKDEIFDVTEKVLGLKRRDFEIAEKSVILTQIIMREDIQEKFDVMEEKSPDALNFVRKLILDAKAVQINEYNEREALKKLRELYQILPGSAKNVLWKLFPKLDSALSGEPGNSSVTGTGIQGTHGPSTAAPGTGIQGTHGPSTAAPGTGIQGTHGPSTAAPGNLKKPFSGNNARDDLKEAGASLLGLSSPEKYKIVSEKISDLLAKEPKDWNEEDLKETLQSFKIVLSEVVALASNKQSAVRLDQDIVNVGHFLRYLCRAFTHTGGCSGAAIERRLNHASKLLNADASKKLKIIVEIIQSQINDLRSTR